ncbi:MAG: hypothetical protein A2902_00600 [Elusimicrobia bacterium RIFCSPLOWO2_01_FULL_64_13]|nr:MAG: hypothetical protein A2902_00600 [Elusimicrobia bacterium RIFCSPLOWO2_01_FULL_64_13]
MSTTGVTCPACGRRLAEAVKHCTHCGVAITPRSLAVSRIINNLGWIGRRALGGFFAGGTGWVLAIAVSRTLKFDSAATDPFVHMLNLFPGNTVLSTAIAGAFIGTVGGMIEQSTYKVFLGGALGALGGILGGLSHPLFERIFSGQLYSYSLAMAAAWGVVGCLVGMTSGLLEATGRKILAGFLCGMLGGVVGGGIGSQMYGAMLMEVRSFEGMSWIAGRLIEGAAGGIVAVNAWFFMGLSEKLYIFRRRQLGSGTKKVCDRCHGENELSAWYCAHCGAALQVAASRDQMRVTPYRGLERLANAFDYLSWLAGTFGVVTSVVVFLSFLIENVMFAVFGSLLVALIVYMLAIVFRSVSDAILMGMQISEKLKERG